MSVNYGSKRVVVGAHYGLRDWLGQRVTLIGAEKLSAAYASALALQGIKAERLPATECTLAGLALLSPQTLAAQ